MTPEEQELLLEQRARGSQKARSHPVVQQQCPGCGTRLAAELVAAVKRGEERCPAHLRPGEPSLGEVLDQVAGGAA